LTPTAIARRRIVRRLVGLSLTVIIIEGVVATPAGADVPNPVGIVVDGVGELLGGAAGFAFDQIAEGIANWVLDAVGFFVQGVLDFLQSSARIDVEAAWFSGPESPYFTVRNIAAALLVGFVFIGLLQGLVNGDPWGMVRRVAGGLPVAVLGMVVTTTVVAKLLGLVDELSASVLSNSDDQALHFLSGFGVAVSGATQGFAAVVIGLVVVLAALLLWIELMVRASLVYLLVAISPLGFAATLWPAARGFLRRTIEILIAVIVSKLVICICLAIGVAALSGAGTSGGDGSVAEEAGGSVGTLLVGAVLFGLAAFSPFLILKLVPVAEAALLAQGASRGPLRTSQSALSTYSSARMVSRLSGPSGAGAAAAVGTPVGAGAVSAVTSSTTGRTGAPAALAGTDVPARAAGALAERLWRTGRTKSSGEDSRPGPGRERP
jgi:hypothetical protein